MRDFRQTRNASKRKYFEVEKAALEAAISRRRGDRGAIAGGQGEGRAVEGAQGLDQPEALELASKTAADAAAQQDAAEQAAKAEAARQHAADAQAAQDEDRKRIAQVSVRAAGEFELGLNPLDSLTAQGACLMMRGAGGQPLLAPSSDRQVTTQEQRQHVRAAGWPPDVLQRLDAPDPPEPDPKHQRKRPPLPTGAGAAFGQVAYRLPTTSPKEKGSLLFS